MMPHSQRRSMQQSNSMMGDCFTWRSHYWVTMAAAIDRLGHDTLMAFLLLLLCRNTCRVTYHTISDIHPTGDEVHPSRIRAVGSAASMPNRSLCHVELTATLWWHNVLWWRWQRSKKRRLRRQFWQQEKNALIDNGGRRHPTAIMGPHSRRRSTQQS
jgi:hypothetical protein